MIELALADYQNMMNLWLALIPECEVWTDQRAVQHEVGLGPCIDINVSKLLFCFSMVAGSKYVMFL